MTAVLLDTHTFVWNLHDPSQLSARARGAIEIATSVYVSAISFYEIGQKARIGRWPEMVDLLPRLHDAFSQRGGHELPVTSEICVDAAMVPWANRDPFARIIAATCARHRCDLISADPAFDDLRAARARSAAFGAERM